MIEPGFYNMDCMEGMKQFPDGFFDLAIVDPPYGISMGHTCGVGGGGTTDHSKAGRIKVYAAAKSNLARQNFTIPSTMTVRRTKGTSGSLSASQSAGSYGAGTSCWTIWARHPA